jgi:hypothetical protein
VPRRFSRPPAGKGQAQEKPPEPQPPEDEGAADPVEPHWEEKTEKTFSVFCFPHAGQGGVSTAPPALNCSKVASQEQHRYSKIGMVLTS